MEIKEQIKSVLASVIHPELGTDIVSSGMVESIEVTENQIRFTLSLVKPRDPFALSVKKNAIQKLTEKFPDYKDKITVLIKEPAPKTQKKGEQPSLPSGEAQVRYKVAISSGKGGVGKSTVTANLAVTLASKGYRVGILDADIYGPSMPKMFGLENYVPVGEVIDGKEFLVPAEKYGVKVMSIGFFIQSDDALIWRGPMATNALRQLIHQTKWGELDFLLIDLPPGTGDVHLTIIGELKLSGAIVVTTPQQVALADAVRGIGMFRQEKVNVPILGLVENMSWFTPLELPDNRYYIFGKGGGVELAQSRNIPLLAQVPLVQSVCESGDEGIPASLDQKESVRQAFSDMAERMITFLETL